MKKQYQNLPLYKLIKNLILKDRGTMYGLLMPIPEDMVYGLLNENHMPGVWYLPPSYCAESSRAAPPPTRICTSTSY